MNVYNYYVIKHITVSAKDKAEASVKVKTKTKGLKHNEHLVAEKTLVSHSGKQIASGIKNPPEDYLISRYGL